MRHAAILLCLLAAALATGCRTQRTATSHATSTATEQVEADLTQTTNTSSGSRLDIKAGADNVTIRITADSVVTPEGTIYQPDVTINVNKPAAEVSATDSSARADSLAAHVNAGTDTATTDDSCCETDTVAVTEPPSKWWLLALLIIPATVIIYKRL